jgi:cell division protein FtsI/penicillin-binding protein 2
LRAALAGVISNGTAGSARIQGVVLAGKTGTAQNSEDPIHHHAWFVGYAPAGDPKIVVAVMIEFGGHGTRAARIASKIIQSYLHVEPTTLINTDG